MATRKIIINSCGGTEFKYSFEKRCLSHKLFVTLLSVAKSFKKKRSRVNKCFMWSIWTLGNQDEPMVALLL